MDETYHAIDYLLRHDPYVIGGLLLIGFASVLFVHIELKLVRADYNFNWVKSLTRSNWGIPGEYLRVRNKHGWSAWPVYLLWPSLFVGVAAFVFGLFRL
jgi:hypothetical protein